MGWEIGFDSRSQRDIGYGVPAVCDHPDCNEKIDRGLGYVCGGEPYGGEHGCGLFFCGSHLYMAPARDADEPEAESGPFDEEQRDDREDWAWLCKRCAAGREPFEPKPDTDEWVAHKATDASWAAWRETDEGRRYFAAFADPVSTDGREH